MALPLRVGLFPYLNVQPLIFGLTSETDVELVIDLPSRIADRFRRGELDVAMIPSFESATLEARVIESACIASDGPVETVTLHHRVELHRVQTLALDEASRTSSALAKILIAEASGQIPESRSFSPMSTDPPDTDAILVIGDPAFTFARPGFTRLDLGREWQRRHAHPFVFALMVVAPQSERHGLSARIEKAKQRGLEAASIIARSYDSGVDPVRAENYLRNVIHYDLGHREKEGLALFYRLAQANGLLAHVKELEFYAF